MKKLTVVMLALALAFTALSTPARAAIEVEGDAYIGIFDKYLWRGFDLSNGQPVAQGGVDVSANGFTLGFWSNVQLSDGNDESAGVDWLPSNEVTETDIYLDYTREFGIVSVSVGDIFYNFNGASASTHELYLSVGVDTLLSPSATVYYDWDLANEDEYDCNGLYYSASIGHGFDVTDAIAVSVGAAAGYNDESPYVDPLDSYWHNYELSLGLDYAVTDQVSVSASYLYSSPISDEAKENINSEELFGVTATLTF